MKDELTLIAHDSTKTFAFYLAFAYKLCSIYSDECYIALIRYTGVWVLSSIPKLIGIELGYYLHRFCLHRKKLHPCHPAPINLYYYNTHDH